MWTDIFFYAKIEILTLTNIPLDIHDGILGVTSISVPGWPPGSASSGLQVNERWALDCLTNVEYYFNIFSPRKKIIHMKLDNFLCFYLKFWSWTSWSSLQVVQILKKVRFR